MKQKIFKFLANLHFAILILLLIASISVLGTIIEQDQTIESYKQNYPLTNKLLGFLSWNMIIKSGLDHLYKTWWFISLIITFGVSLFSCTFLQQIPTFKIARRCQFFRTLFQFRQLKFFKILNQSKLSNLFFKLKKNHYSIFQQKNIIYCYHGLIGRLGPILVHFSMIIILLGTIVTSLTGFNGQEIVPKSEMFHIQNIFSSGKITKFPEISTRINDFWIVYQDQQIIRQFYSNLSILNFNGEEIYNKTIFVNSPINYNNLDYYQTNWNLIALRFQIQSNSFIQYPIISLTPNSDKFWLTWIPAINNLTTGLTILVNNLQGYCSIYSETGQFLGNLELNETLTSILPYSFVELINSAGLQIKTDPGIIIIYFGFFFLMLTVIISYKSYSQIWILKDNSKIFIGGNTSRSTFMFEFEFFKLIK